MADTSTSSPQRRDSLSGVQPSRRDRSPWRIMDPVRGGIRFAMALAIGPVTGPGGLHAARPADDPAHLALGADDRPAGQYRGRLPAAPGGLPAFALRGLPAGSHPAYPAGRPHRPPAAGTGADTRRRADRQGHSRRRESPARLRGRLHPHGRPGLRLAPAGHPRAAVARLAAGTRRPGRAGHGFCHPGCHRTQQPRNQRALQQRP